MKQDGQVMAGLLIKKFTRLSTGWFIKPASPSPEDKAIADFYNQQLEDLPGTVLDFLLAMMTALDYGYSLEEKNYYRITEGEWAGKIGLKSLKSKMPHDFKFILDPFDNVIGLEQTQGTDTRLLPIEKFIHLAWMSEWENPYGRSDLKAAYIPWWQKDVIMRFQAIWLERYPSPFLLGKYPPGTSEDTKTDLLGVLEDLQIHTEAIIPEGLEIDTVKMDRSGSDIYTKAIDKRDLMISRALLIPELLGFNDRGGSGSYALGKKQVAIFLGVLKYLGDTIMETIHEQLTIPFISWNFDVEHYPRMEFYPLTEESTEEKAKILAILSTAKVIDGEDPETRAAIGDYLNILPEMNTDASDMAMEALDFSEPFKFIAPDGSDSFTVEIMETSARMELLNDALQRT
jgi:phage gp29-like protein